MRKLARSVSAFVRRHQKTIACVGAVAGSQLVSSAQTYSTDAVAIATTASSDFAIIAPITLTIAGFYVILRLAKRTVK